MITRLLLTSLCVLSLTAALVAQGTGDSAPVRGESSTRWDGGYFPNVPLVDQDGKTRLFFDDLIEGKVVMINFIYTSCPDTCPLETARLKEVTQLLGDRVGDDIHIYSITIDPDVDTYEVMAEYRDMFDIGEGWDFLTGNKEDIDLLRKKLGLYIEEIQGIKEDGTQDHNLSLVMGNQATGQWKKASPFENPYILAEQVGGWFHDWKTPSLAGGNYEDAPELRNMSKGESMYRTRCAVCHAIGPGLIQRVGPNLLDVHERRDPEWLARWVLEPDVMLAEKDPTAVALMTIYNDLPMPNMQLSEYEVELLLEYIEDESLRVLAEAGDGADALLAEVLAPPVRRKESTVESCCAKRNELDVHDDGQEHEDEALLADADAPGAGTDSTPPSSLEGLLAELKPAHLSVALGLVLGCVSLVLGRRRRSTLEVETA